MFDFNLNRCVSMIVHNKTGTEGKKYFMLTKYRNN